MDVVTKTEISSNKVNLSTQTSTVVVSWVIVSGVLSLIARKYTRCNDRVPLTYVILAYTVGSVVLLEHYLAKYQIKVHLLVSFLFAISFLVATHFTAPNSTGKTILFFLFVVAMSLVLQPLYRIADRFGVAKPALISVGLWFLVLSVVSVKWPTLVTPKWGSYLFFSLLGLVIVRFVMLFTKPSGQVAKWSSYIGIVIFSGYVLYDSQTMRDLASKCQHPYDFIDNIIKLFLDFINLWTDTMALGVHGK